MGRGGAVFRVCGLEVAVSTSNPPAQIRDDAPALSPQEKEDVEFFHQLSHWIRTHISPTLECAIVVIDGDQRPYLKVRRKD